MQRVSGQIQSVHGVPLRLEKLVLFERSLLFTFVGYRYNELRHFQNKYEATGKMPVARVQRLRARRT